MSQQSSRLRLWCVAVLMALLWVGGASGEAPHDVTQQELEELRALGYIDYAPEIADAQKSGAHALDRERVAPGYTLVTAGRVCRARLWDIDGNPVHSWEEDDCSKWWNARLLPNGDLLVNGIGLRAAATDDAKERDDRRYAVRFDWDGNVVWRTILRSHHDGELLASGESLVLTDSVRQIPELSTEYRVRDNELTWLSKQGEVVQTVSLYDAVTSGVEFPLEKIEPKRSGGVEIGLFHANGVDTLRHEHLVGRAPIYSLDHVAVTSRNQDSVMVIDRKSGKLVWAWGKGEISGPHDTTWLENGNFLIFDNGMKLEQSRVIEVDPLSGKIVWQYPGETGRPFYSFARGSAQRLDNGNTLISNSQAGEAFEVTREGEIVWQYWNPDVSPKGHRGVIIRVKRYPSAWAEPHLQKK